MEINNLPRLVRQQMANPGKRIKGKPAYWVHFRDGVDSVRRHLVLIGVDIGTGILTFDSPNPRHGPYQLDPKDIVTIKQMSI